MAFIEILENIFGHFKFLQRGLKPDDSTFEHLWLVVLFAGPRQSATH